MKFRLNINFSLFIHFLFFTAYNQYKSAECAKHLEITDLSNISFAVPIPFRSILLKNYG